MATRIQIADWKAVGADLVSKFKADLAHHFGLESDYDESGNERYPALIQSIPSATRIEVENGSNYRTWSHQFEYWEKTPNDANPDEISVISDETHDALDAILQKFEQYSGSYESSPIQVNGKELDFEITGNAVFTSLIRSQDQETIEATGWRVTFTTREDTQYDKCQIDDYFSS